MHAFLYKGKESKLFTGDGSDTDYKSALADGWKDAPWNEPFLEKAVDEKATTENKETVQPATKFKKLNLSR